MLVNQRKIRRRWKIDVSALIQEAKLLKLDECFGGGKCPRPRKARLRKTKSGRRKLCVETVAQELGDERPSWIRPFRLAGAVCRDVAVIALG